MVEVVQRGRFESLAAEDEHNSDGDLVNRRKLAEAVADDQGTVEDVRLDIAGCIQAGD